MSDDDKLDMVLRLVEKLDRTIHGNGTPGLLVRVDRLEQSLLEFVETRTALRKWALGLAGLFVIAVVAILWKLVIEHPGVLAAPLAR